MPQTVLVLSACIKQTALVRYRRSAVSALVTYTGDLPCPT
jgi:hypothetical protein